MPVVSVYADLADGYLDSSNVLYATARTGGTLTAFVGDDAARVGQLFSSGYSVYETFLSFDTSALPDGATITAASLWLFGLADTSGTDFDIQACYQAWSATLTTADWVSGAGLPTAAGSLNTLGFTTTGYNQIALTDLTGISRTGTTDLMLVSSRHRAGNTPTGGEFVSIVTREPGTATAAFLEVTYLGDTTLTVQNATHLHSVDGVTVTEFSASTLSVADAVHAHSADNLALTQEHMLVVDDSVIAHAADVVAFVGSGVPGTLTLHDRTPTLDLVDRTPTLDLVEIT